MAQHVKRYTDSITMLTSRTRSKILVSLRKEAAFDKSGLLTWNSILDEVCFCGQMTVSLLGNQNEIGNTEKMTARNIEKMRKKGWEGEEVMNRGIKIRTEKKEVTKRSGVNHKFDVVWSDQCTHLRCTIIPGVSSNLSQLYTCDYTVLDGHLN